MVDQRAREHLIDYSIATNPRYEPNWHHEVIAEELEKVESGEFIKGGKEILMVFVPPRHGKSEESSINFPSWYLGRNPNKEIITASYSSDLAQDFGTKTRDLISSEAYSRIFTKLELKEDQKAKAKWMTKDGGSYISSGVGGAITGRGADILLIDDPLKNREEAESDTIRNKIWSWFTSVALTRLEPNAVVIIILTRWHKHDLAGMILADPEFAKVTKVIEFPAIAIDDEKYRKKGEALWPWKYDLEYLEKKRKQVGIYDWSALYQQQPILTENQEFKDEWFKYRTQQEVDRLNTRKFLTIDTAISKKASADYTGFCDNSIDKENFWNIKGWRMKLDPKELIDYLFTLQANRGYEKIGIEKTIYLDAIKPFLDDECRKRNKFLPIVELKHNQVNKEIRIRGLIPRYSSKSVYHIEGECRDLEDELVSFPQALHDDISDAEAYQLQIAESNDKKPIEQPKVESRTEYYGGDENEQNPILKEILNNVN